MVGSSSYLSDLSLHATCHISFHFRKIKRTREKAGSVRYHAAYLEIQQPLSRRMPPLPQIDWTVIAGRKVIDDVVRDFSSPYAASNNTTLPPPSPVSSPLSFLAHTAGDPAPSKWHRGAWCRTDPVICLSATATCRRPLPKRTNGSRTEARERKG